MDDLSAWWRTTTFTNGNLLSTDPTHFGIVTLDASNAHHGAKALCVYTYASEGNRAVIGGPPVPIDRSRTYRARISAQQVLNDSAAWGDRVCYFGVAFFDRTGALISTATTGWGGGTFHYIISGVQPAHAPAWSDWEGFFGAGYPSRPFPAGAYSMSIAFYPNYGGNQESFSNYQDARIEEVIGSALIEDGAITTPKIYAGAVTTATLDAGAVTADKLSVLGENYLNDPDFSYSFAPSTSDWTLEGSATIDATAGKNASKCARVPAASGSRIQSNDFPVQAGDSLVVSGWFKRASGTDTGAGNTAKLLEIGWKDWQGNSLGYSTGYVHATTLSSSTWTRFTLTDTAPTNAVRARLLVNRAPTAGDTVILADELRATRRNSAEMIVDGAIIAGKLATDSVVTTNLTALNITSPKIADDAAGSTYYAETRTDSGAVPLGSWTLLRGITIPAATADKPRGDIHIEFSATALFNYAGNANFLLRAYTVETDIVGETTSFNVGAFASAITASMNMPCIHKATLAAASAPTASFSIFLQVYKQSTATLSFIDRCVRVQERRK